MINRQVSADRLDDHSERGVAARRAKIHSIISSRVFIGALLVVVLAYLACGSTREISIYDEGLICYGADSVLHGGIPYRDFWTVYGPGQFYMLAVMFRVLGTSLLVARIYTLLIEWIVVILAYFVSRKLGSPLVGLLSCVAVALWLGFDRTVLYPPIPALAFSLASFLIIAHPPSSRRYVLAGCLLGCAILVRHDIGVYGFIGQTLTIIGREIFGNFSGIEAVPSRIASAFKWVLLFSIGTCAVVLPVVVALLWTVPRELLYELFVNFPFRIYPRFRSIPFPLAGYFAVSGAGGALKTIERLALLSLIPLTIFLLTSLGWLKSNWRRAWYWLATVLIAFLPIMWQARAHTHQLRRTLAIFDLLIFGLPLLIIFMAVCLIVLTWPKKYLQSEQYWLAVGMTAFACFMCISVRVRPDAAHFVVPVTLSLILFPWLLHATKILPLVRPVSLSLNLFLLTCVSLLSLGCLAHNTSLPWLDRNSARFKALENDRAKGITVEGNEDTDDLVAAVRYVRQKVSPGEFIYVGNTRHDRIRENNAMFYFLSGRKSATRYSELHPGVATTAKVQSEIISDLKARNVAYVVLWAEPSLFEPNQSSESSCVTILDHFIHANYEQVAEFGNYKILRRSGNTSNAGAANNESTNLISRKSSTCSCGRIQRFPI